MGSVFSGSTAFPFFLVHKKTHTQNTGQQTQQYNTKTCPLNDTIHFLDVVFIRSKLRNIKVDVPTTRRSTDRWQRRKRLRANAIMVRYL
jgi:hypothetical protein